MIKNEIGINAGIIWNLLSEADIDKDASIKYLKSSSKLKDSDLFLALGWLARESKIYFYEENKEMRVALIS